MNKREKAAFNREVLSYYQVRGRRDLPWRKPEPDGVFYPYKILVSELMLQQTQVPRVIPKFTQFIAQFPNTYALAHASLAEVLAVWNGLGYNRRAKFLWQAASIIENELHGGFPLTIDELVKLPGVGRNTAGAIMAYAYDEPVAFVETNIRSVFIYHFFKGHLAGVDDKAILDLVEQTLPNQDVRSWYWALMDYGTFLKQTVGNTARASKTYTKQSKFSGSRRQIRGRVIRLLLERQHTLDELYANVQDDRLKGVLQELVHERLIRRIRNTYKI
jgi:A/G-specific adenine glycosylase